MLSKNQIKFITALKQKKFRDENKLFVAEGSKIISELLDSAVRVKYVYSIAPAVEKLQKKKGVEYVEIKEAELERISSLTTPNEMLAVCEIPEHTLEMAALKDRLTLVLDTIKDPGNLGTIIRIADWFGIENIICSNESVDAFNPKVVQATMGAIARIKIHYKNLKEFLSANQEQLQLPVYGALLEGTNIYTVSLSSSALLVIGNESRGIADELIPFILHKLTIPSFSHFKSTQGETESLNAAVATAVICSEFRRK
jgi:TrmH family RNA methyltransferase